jgi:20S proteasome subunit alpha 7
MVDLQCRMTCRNDRSDDCWLGAASVEAGCDHDINTYDLCMVEPNGVAYSYYGVALGKGKQAAKTDLEKLNLHREPCTVNDAVKYTAKILTMLHRENCDNDGKTLEIEMSWICPASKNEHFGIPLDIIASAKAWAQEQLDADDGDAEDDEGMEE